MPKNTFGEASSAATARRGLGANAHSNVTAAATALAGLADQHHAGGTQSTTAIGLFRGAWLLVARQGSNPAATSFAGLAGQVEAALNLTHTPALIVVNNSFATETGLHAEMMIVRYILVGLQGHVTKAALQNQLVIGVTKGCCADCAGWLNRYHVPHNVPVAGGVAQEPSPTLQWKHPVSGAAYMGGGSLESYKHPGSNKSLSHLDHFEFY